MSILIATPCFNYSMLEPNWASHKALEKELTAAGVEYEYLTHCNDSLITRARDVLAATFLKETTYACLLFIDGDIEFEPAGVARLWNLCHGGAAVAVGCYRRKKPNSTHSAWVEGSLEEIGEKTEPFEVDYAGTGFMMIRRDTLEKLRDAHPDWEYEEGDVGTCWAFFQDPIEDRCHLSEDFFLCKRVRELGLKIIMDPLIKLKHWGMIAY